LIQASLRAGRFRVLGNDAFELQLASVGEHLVAVRPQVLAVDDRVRQAGFVEQHLEDALAFDQRRLPQIKALQIQKIERIEQQAVLIASGEFGLQFGKAGAAVFDDDDLAIKDCALDRDVEGAGDHRKPFRPVETRAGEDGPPLLVDVQLDAIAIVFDLVEPLIARGSPGARGRELRYDESGHLRRLGALDHSREETCLRALAHSTIHKKPLPRVNGEHSIGISRGRCLKGVPFARLGRRFRPAAHRGRCSRRAATFPDVAA